MEANFARERGISKGFFFKSNSFFERDLKKIDGNEGFCYFILALIECGQRIRASSTFSEGNSFRELTSHCIQHSHQIDAYLPSDFEPKKCAMLHIVVRTAEEMRQFNRVTMTNSVSFTQY